MSRRPVDRQTLLQAHRRRTVGALLAGLLAGALLLAPAPAELAELAERPPWPGAAVVHAQGGMDIGILSPSFAALPQSVQPGQSFTLAASTATNARCVGQVTFRNEPPVNLDEQTAVGGACTWTVEVPPTLRNGSGSVWIDVSRSGQGWFLAGVFYVNAPGESR